MGLSIYYSGRLKEATSLPLLIEEVKEVCSIYGWNYNIEEDSFPMEVFDNQESLKPIYGISFTPTESETVCLTFLSNGVMACPARVTFFGESTNERERNFIYQIAVKTQYAGANIHAIIINL